MSENSAHLFPDTEQLVPACTSSGLALFGVINGWNNLPQDIK